MSHPVDGPYTAEQIDDALTALIAYAGNYQAACRYLEGEGKRAPTPVTLSEWARTKYWGRYEELRDKVAAQNENTLANNYLDAARFATETAMIAVEKARDRLEGGKDDDPARTAANLARVAQSATDKRLALQGRPTHITETRNPIESVRALVAAGVLQMPTEPLELEEATEAGEADDEPATE